MKRSDDQMAGEITARTRTEPGDGYRAPGDQTPIGGIKVIAEHRWFAARPSDTEGIHQIHAESFLGARRHAALLTEAQAVVHQASVS